MTSRILVRLAKATLPVASNEEVVSRRHWIGVAAGAGIAGALGSWLATLRVSPVLAIAPPPPTAVKVSCKTCWCCQLGIGPDGDTRCDKYCCSGCTGFSGGGVVQTATGSAEASFFGESVQLEGNHNVVTGGALTWFDAGWHGTGLLLQSTRITSYGRIAGTDVRQLVGLAQVNGKGKYQFVLRAVDTGKPGSGSDTVHLTVSGIPSGGAGGKGDQYVADGRIVHGDITTNLVAAVSVKK